MISLKNSLLRELGLLEGITEKTWPGREDGFSSLLYKGKEFAHFHNDHEIDLKLTRKIISAEGLQHPKNSRYHPDRSVSSPWIELQFHNDGDVSEIVRLVKIAVAHI